MKQSPIRVLSLLVLACAANRAAMAQTVSGAAGATANAMTGYAAVAAMSPTQGAITPLVPGMGPLANPVPSLTMGTIPAVTLQKLEFPLPSNTSLPQGILHAPDGLVNHAPGFIADLGETTMKSLAENRSQVSSLQTSDLTGAWDSAGTGVLSLSNSYRTASRAAASYAKKRSSTAKHRSVKRKAKKTAVKSRSTRNSSPGESSSPKDNGTDFSDLDGLGNPQRRQSDGPDSESDEPTRGPSSGSGEFGNSSGNDSIF